MRTVGVVAANKFQVEAMQRAPTAGTFSLDGCTMAEIGRPTGDWTLTDWDSASWLRRDVPLVLVHPGTEGWQPPHGDVLTLEYQEASALLLGLQWTGSVRVGAISI